MAWNEPNGGRDPWNQGGRRGNDGGSPPDVDELLNRLRSRFGKGSGGGGSGGPSLIGGGSLGLIITLIAALWLASGFYVVDEQERGVVLRFGQYTTTTDPGLRWHLPWPVEQVERVNITQVRSVTDSADMLTQDENIVELELKVQYRLSSAGDYLFKVRDPDGTLRQVTKSAVRDVVGHNTMDFILTEGRQAVADETKQLLQDRLDEYQTGLIVTEVNLQNAQPPQRVQGAFADAIKAREDQQRLKNEAEAYANDRLPRSRGQAAREIAEATAYRDRLVAEAEGDAARFNSLLTEYKKAPGITRERLYLDAINDVMSNSSKIMLDVDQSNPLLYLPLDKLSKGGGVSTPQSTSSFNSAAPSTSSHSDSGAREGRSRDRGRR